MHLEFQSSYNIDDLIRFGIYDFRLWQRDERKVITVIIYSSDVKIADTSLNIGSLIYAPDKIMMYKYDGSSIFKELETKIKEGQELSDVNMLNLIFMPLMKNDMPMEEIAEKSIRLAQTIQDKRKRNICVASVFAFANKYLDENSIAKLLEVLKMTDLATLLVLDAVNKRDMEIAKKALKKGFSVDDVFEITGLNKSTIKKIQKEITKEKLAK